jgi:hypothetical protein
MKVDLYMDVFQGCYTANLYATSNPCAKSDTARRLMITVNVPDEFLFGKVDAVLPVIEKVEVDK